MATRDGYVDSHGTGPHDDAYRGRSAEAPGILAPSPVSRVTLTLGGAVVLLLLVGLAGAAVDLLLGAHLDVGTLVLLPMGAFLATLLVHRQGLFMIVIAPPLVYLLLSVVAILVSGTGLGLTALAAGVVFGFPTMAIATLVAVVVAGLRQVRGR